MNVTVRIIAPLIVALAAVGGASDAQAQTRCFGAAARDPDRRPCGAPALSRSVVPTPAAARSLRNAPCRFVEHRGELHVCAFGVDPEDAAGTIGLVGDSHASHWRAALAHVVDAYRWRGLSITQTSCPLSLARRDLPEPARSTCARWKRQVFAWFREHREVRTVFVAGLSGGTGVVPTAGRSEFATSVAGYIGAWKALPRTIRRIVVIRDSPKARPDTARCVTRALARHRPAGRACALPRSRVLYPDPLVEAARRLRSRRVRVVDLSRFFCDRRSCFPVVGGALVHKDPTHLTAVFATTLGPFLLRAVRRLG